MKEILLICEDLAKKVLKDTELSIVLKVINTLTLLQNQYHMIEELLLLKQNLEQNNEKLEEIMTNYQTLQEFLIKLNNTDEFCEVLFQKIDVFYIEMLKKFKKKLDKLLLNWNTKRKTFYFNFLSIYVF